jgi:hypothetical protein
MCQAILLDRQRYYRAASFSFFNGRTFTFTEAGFAANH